MHKHKHGHYDFWVEKEIWHGMSVVGTGVVRNINEQD